MAIQSVTKPMALDETLQGTNTALGLLGKDATLQSIVTALASIGLNTVGNLVQLGTEQKTSLVAAINELMAGKIPNSAIGVANGVAELDANGLVPSSQIPDAVDEIIEGYLYNGTFYEDSAHTKPITGKTGKIYVDLSTEKTYRWGGSAYVEISASLALGETSSTAYRGDRGKTAYDHSQDASRVASAIVEGLYKVGATAQGHISGLTAVQKGDITALGIPGQDTTYNDATQLVHGLMSADDKTKLDGISTGAEVNVQSDWNQRDSSADDFIKNKPQNLVQDANYVHTDNNYSNAEKAKFDTKVDKTTFDALGLSVVDGKVCITYNN